MEEKALDLLRELILEEERSRLGELRSKVERLDDRFDQFQDGLVDRIAESIEVGAKSNSRLMKALGEQVSRAFGIAARMDPELVAQSIYPVIGPAVRRSIAESLRQIAKDIDDALRDALSLKAMGWRLEAWRAGMPYAQIALRHQLGGKVEHLFLVQARSGILLGHQACGDVEIGDADAVAGMMTAVADFVKDSIAVPDGDSRLDSATVGEYRLLISDGPVARLAALVSGVPAPDLRNRMDEILESWHATHAGAQDGTGWEDSGLEPGILDQLNARPPPPSVRNRVWPLALLAALACVVGLLGVGFWRSHVWSQELNALRVELAVKPGFVLLGIDSPSTGVAIIKGLLDPAAEDPRENMDRLHSQAELTWQLRPYVSAEAPVAAARLANALRLPEETVRVDQAGVARLTGRVPFAAWYAARRQPPYITGVSRIDASSLSFYGQDRYDRILAEMDALRFGFVRNVEPQAAAHLEIRKMIGLVEQLQARAKQDRIVLVLYVSGYTDEPGGHAVNRDLRFRRAEWLASQLSGILRSPNRLVLNLEMLAGFEFHGKERAATVRTVLEPLGG